MTGATSLAPRPAPISTNVPMMISVTMKNFVRSSILSFVRLRTSRYSSPMMMMPKTTSAIVSMNSRVLTNVMADLGRLATPMTGFDGGFWANASRGKQNAPTTLPI